MPSMCYPDRAAWLCLQRINRFLPSKPIAELLQTTELIQMSSLPPLRVSGAWLCSHHVPLAQAGAALVETPWAQGKSWGLSLHWQKSSQAREKIQLEKQLCRLQHLKAQNLGIILTSWWVFPHVTSSWCLDLSPTPNHSSGLSSRLVWL